MQEENTTSIEYFKDLRRVADLLNGIVFHGNQVIRPGNLREKNPVLHNVTQKDGKFTAIENTLDLAIEVNLGKVKFLLALQAQTREHYAMPVRILHEKGTDYYNQWKKLQKKHKEAKDLKNSAELLSGIKKGDRFYPVLHIVIYFGRKKWIAAKSMNELFEKNAFPKELQRLFQEKQILIFEVRHFQKTSLFQTDLRLVCEFLQRTEDKTQLKNYIAENELYFSQLPEDTYNLLAVMGGITPLKQLKNDVKTEKGEFDMCKAFDDMLEDSRLEGERKGIREGIRKGENRIKQLNQILLSAERYEDLMLASTNRNYSMKLMKEFGII